MRPLQPAHVISNPSGIKAFEEKEIWINNLYTVLVTRNIPVPAIIDKAGHPITICWLSIKRNDKQPIFDWRDMQWIKNQLVGEECEGCQLFPTESRLVDGANQFHLWVFENSTLRFPFGFEQRSVTEKIYYEGMVQRPFPDERKPADLASCEEKAAQIVNQLKALTEKHD